MDLQVTLIVPAYKAQDYIASCLKSILSQDYDRHLFEVLFVINGPVDKTPDIIDQTLSTVVDLNWRVVYDAFASLSNARNVGIDLSRGRWVTWVDVDDWLSDNYLSELAAAAHSGIVPLASVVDVDETTGAEMASPISEQALSVAEGVHDAETLWRSLGFAACKLLETVKAREQKFDVNLQSGEDVAYFAPFFSKMNLKFDNTPAHRGARYFRLVRDGSMSRQAPTFDFSVTQRLQVMKHLDSAAQNAETSLSKLMHSMMRSQALFTKRYLDDHPEDLSEAIAAYDKADLAYTPWNVIAIKADCLAISYNFSPFADASAVVAAKRLANSGKQWNVISNTLASVRQRDDQFHEMILPYISSQKTIQNTPIFGSWRGISEFCSDGLKAIADIESVNGPQATIYSRSMWPASHYLAFLYKIANPSARWIAEFSDPLRKDVRGTERAGAIGDDAIAKAVVAGVDSMGFRLSQSETLFSLCEKLPYMLADEIIFTNPHQMSYMLSYLDDDRLRVRARSVGKISAQPVPPARFFRQLNSNTRGMKSDQVTIGIFGSFYPNRGPGAIVDALREVGPNVRAKIQLQIYSSNWSELVDVFSGDLNVHVAPALPYLSFLEKASQTDVLLVCDADSGATGHRLNPYLPSKVSDYEGAARPIWGMYEAGSVLSRSNVQYLSRIGDLRETVKTLERIVEEQL